MTTQYQTILIKTRRGLLQVPGSARTGSTDLKHRCAGAASLANPSGFCPHPPQRRSTILYHHYYYYWYEVCAYYCYYHYHYHCASGRHGVSLQVQCVYTVCQSVNVNMHTAPAKLTANNMHLRIRPACIMHCPGV